MAKLYVQAVPPADLNKNTEWFMYPGVWTTYILILFFSWLLVLSVGGCTPGMAWTLVNLAHFAITYHFFHWKKGTPFADDQGMYNRLTWWEQMDSGKAAYSQQKISDCGSCGPILDSLTHDRLSTSYALPQHCCSRCAGCCKTTKHAQVEGNVTPSSELDNQSTCE
ncbi:hypothetical protein GUJ93_ZPchr0014g46987 [Zizania palustris]|uniref:Uncharacterized protein n=1 Tax=Zizania palustris TaxID=103762 RepID=A0A8J5VSJ6_ZIZPA|nr:hypothetical protein GUJ93_ZPchr0014g46987 [Zizania palustris]